ncbi:MAG: class I SAM-dependent methyltransferase [Bacteroidota bacterium]
MTVKIAQKLGGVSETLLMTLYARARESQRPDAMIRDDLAVQMVQQIDCDFSRLKMQRHDEVAIVMRMRKFDDHARGFFARNPEGVVVHIGCGLDTRFERVDNGRVEWFDLDMPDVIALRKDLLNEDSGRYHMLASSVFDEGWMAEVSCLEPRRFMFLAEGVFPYFEESQIRELFLSVRDRFPGCEVVCDAHTPFVIWADNLQLAVSGVQARLHWRLKDPRDVEKWGQGIRLLDEWNYYEDDEPRLKSVRWARQYPHSRNLRAFSTISWGRFNFFPAVRSPGPYP